MFNLKEIVIAFVVVTILLGFGLLILLEVQSEILAQSSNTSAAYNATGEGIDALGSLSGWLPLLALVIIAAIIIGYLLVSFGGQKASA